MENPQRIIVEITNHCNLDCEFCIRRSWSASPGMMSEETYTKFLSDLGEFPAPPAVLFGGYGEPLSHPRALEFIQGCNRAGASTTLITNGSLLDPGLMEDLVLAGLEKIWISVDSAHREAGGKFPSSSQDSQFFESLAAALEPSSTWSGKLQLGLVFVLTRSNGPELLDLIAQGQDLGLSSYYITNLEAYSSTLSSQTPYRLDQFRQPGAWHASQTRLVEELEAISSLNGTQIEGPLLQSISRCPFAERGDLVLRWDGELSPCLPLLYDHTVHIGSWTHHQESFSVGNIQGQSIREIWPGPGYSALRARLLARDYSPCLHCRDCWLSDSNLNDCMGDEHPACGGCLWAEGLIGCP